MGCTEGILQERVAPTSGLQRQGGRPWGVYHGEMFTGVAEVGGEVPDAVRLHNGAATLVQFAYSIRQTLAQSAKHQKQTEPAELCSGSTERAFCPWSRCYHPRA